MKKLSLIFLSFIFYSNFVFAQATNYPTRPVKMIVGFTAGGAVDAAGRTMAQALQKSLDQSFIVDNRPGVGGMLAMQEVARASPDGYTLAVGSAGPLTVSPTIFKNANFDPRQTLAPVIWFVNNPGILVIRKDLPVNNIADLVALSKSKQLNMASAGTGSVLHLMGEYFQDKMGIKWTHIPYKGSGPALLDLAAGRTDVALDLITSSAPMVKSGQLRALAVTSTKRSLALPDVPTLNELGYDGLVMGSWMGLLAPKGTSSESIDKLNAILNQAIKDPELITRVSNAGGELTGGSPQDLANLMNKDLNRWAIIINRLNIQPD
ncbi:MAG: tripartite tricarboxylate transporter substrate binding protein [Betaproteobacteria bacterium]|nr:tripartite tricarboxylate transporter substrate binding protein [Betaproteobacteria bacterium]